MVLNDGEIHYDGPMKCRVKGHNANGDDESRRRVVLPFWTQELSQRHAARSYNKQSRITFIFRAQKETCIRIKWTSFYLLTKMPNFEAPL